MIAVAVIGSVLSGVSVYYWRRAQAAQTLRAERVYCERGIGAAKSYAQATPPALLRQPPLRMRQRIGGSPRSTRTNRPDQCLPGWFGFGAASSGWARPRITCRIRGRGTVSTWTAS